MEIRKEEFEQQLGETLDTLLQHLAEHAEVSPEEFYRMTCMVENLSFFGPVLYELLQKSKK